MHANAKCVEYGNLKWLACPYAKGVRHSILMSATLVLAYSTHDHRLFFQRPTTEVEICAKRVARRRDRSEVTSYCPARKRGVSSCKICSTNKDLTYFHRTATDHFYDMTTCHITALSVTNSNPQEGEWSSQCTRINRRAHAHPTWGWSDLANEAISAITETRPSWS
jgi:hypothetical protein